MTVLRTTLATMLGVLAFASIAALAVASPPAGNPAGGCGQGPPGDHSPPAGQYGGPGGHEYGLPPKPPKPIPPGHEYGSPGSQYGGNADGGGPEECPPHGQYQYGP
jgi:hypothetical protein